MDLIKYDMTNIWAVAGDVVAPDAAKIRAGWGVEVVPRQWWNWFENRQDNNIAYMLQKGFPEWDATTEYIINKSYVQRNGIVYKATATNTNSDPVALTSWVRAFADYSTASNALGSLTVAVNQLPYFNGTSTATTTTLTPFARTILDDADAPTVRATISAQQSSSNLTALSGVSPVANGLPYFTDTTTMGLATLTSFGRSLIDDADATAARLTLGLTTAAITQLMSNNMDSDTSKIMRAGAFGLGSFVDLRSHIVATGTPADCFGTGTAFGFVNGGSSPAGGLAIPGLTGTWYGTLQVNGQYSDASGLSAISRVFTTTNGRVFTQTAASSSTWGAWNESWTTSNLVKTTSNNDTTAGRVVQTGDYGLGNSIILATNANLDNVIVSGWYRLNTHTGLPAGAPFGQMQVIRGSDTITQIVYGWQSPMRMFARGGNPTIVGGTGTWSPWVEVYNTGNTAQIVADVQAGIQPQLDAKVNRSGDVMTGQLVAPTFFANQGGIYLKAQAGSTQTTDAALIVDTATSTLNGGRLVITSGSTYNSGTFTSVGSGSFQSALSTSGLLTAASGQINGNLAVTGTSTLSTTNISGILTASSTVNMAGGTAGGVQVTSGSVSIFPVSNNNTANCHVWFKATDASIRGVVYAQSNSTITIQAGGNIAANFFANGTAAFNGIQTGTIAASGRINGTDAVFQSRVYTNSGNSWLDTDGNVYGGAWGGYLSGYLGANMITPSNLRGNLAGIRAGELGSYALLQHPGGASIGPNGSVAGTDMSWATCGGGFNERVGYGTWVVMGRISTGNLPVATTLCMRYA